MDKSTVEKYKSENRPVWFLGTRTAMPVKARIVKVCEDGSTGECAKVDYIYEDESAVFGSENVRFDDMYESKDDLMAAVYKDILERTAEIKAAVQTKDDCIRFMFLHTVSCAGEYTDWTARHAIQKIAKKRWGLELG